VPASIGDRNSGPATAVARASAFTMVRGLAAECPTLDPKGTIEGRDSRVLKDRERCGVDACHRASAALHTAAAGSKIDEPSAPIADARRSWGTKGGRIRCRTTCVGRFVSAMRR
jgi:hypothetical protein